MLESNQPPSPTLYKTCTSYIRDPLLCTIVWVNGCGLPPGNLYIRLAGMAGFEPTPRESKSLVLPLHHIPRFVATAPVRHSTIATFLCVKPAMTYLDLKKIYPKRYIADSSRDQILELSVFIDDRW